MSGSAKLHDLLHAADRLAVEIMTLDAKMPGLAIMTARILIQKLPASDAATLLKPPAPIERDAGDGKAPAFDPKVLIG